MSCDSILIHSPDSEKVVDKVKDMSKDLVDQVSSEITRLGEIIS